MKSGKTGINARVLTLCAGFVSLSAGHASGQTVSFRSLGGLPQGQMTSQASSVSAFNRVVVGDALGANGPEGFRWAWGAPVMLGVGDLVGGGYSSSARDVNANGSVIVGFSSGDFGDEAFRWTATEGMVGLGFLDGGNVSEAHTVSADGNVVAGLASSFNGQEAFVWRVGDEGMTPLGDFPGLPFISAAFGMSGDGRVVVGAGSPMFRGARAAAWRNVNGQWSAIEALPEFIGGGHLGSGAYGVSFDGRVITGFCSRGISLEAVRWTATGIHSIGDLPGGTVNAVASACSYDGSVVVGRGTSAAGDEAFIWNPVDGMRSIKQVLLSRGLLAVNGWTLWWATGVSADGTVVVGEGLNPSGIREAWAAVLPRYCAADVDDGTGRGIRDGGVTLDDFLYYLAVFDAGLPGADVDDGTGTNTRDGGVTIDDLLYYLSRFSDGC